MQSYRLGQSVSPLSKVSPQLRPAASTALAFMLPKIQQKYTKAVHQLTPMRIKRILRNWKRRLDCEYKKFLQNPVGYLETLVLLEASLLTKTFCVPFELELLCSSDGNYDWRSPRVKSSNGFPLYLTTCMNTLFTAVVLIFVSMALHDKFVFMQHGMFTPDALLYVIVALNFAAANAAAFRALFCRHEFASIFNAYVAFSENWARKLAIEQLRYDPHEFFTLFSFSFTYL